MFSLEFIMMKMAMDLVQGLCYKFHMMGVQVNGPTCTFCNNKSMVKNTT